MDIRSLLFVPGDSERKLASALGTEADALIIDLEDSVAPSNKPAARRIASDFLDLNPTRQAIIYFRVNDLLAGMIDDDLAAVMRARPDGVMLPKCRGGSDVQQLSAKLRVHEAEFGIADGATRIVPIVSETAAGVLAAATYAGAGERLAGLTWGAEDLSADLGVATARDAGGGYTDVFRLARSLTLLAAASAGVASIDTVFPAFKDSDAFGRECAEAVRDGFTAKMAIHPSQLAAINEAFTPSPESVARAESIVSAFRAAGETGVVAIEGRMYDRPHLRQAVRLLSRAQRFGARST